MLWNTLLVAICFLFPLLGAVELEPWPEGLELQTNETVHFQGFVREPWSPEPSIWIVDANVPVIMNRLTAGYSLWYHAPVQGALIIIKSDCETLQTSVTVDKVDLSTPSGNFTDATKITIEAETSSMMNATFFESSTITAVYDCGGYLCERPPTPEPTSKTMGDKPTETPGPTVTTSIIPVTDDPTLEPSVIEIEQRQTTSKASTARLMIVSIAMLVLTTYMVTDGSTSNSVRAALCIVPLAATVFFATCHTDTEETNEPHTVARRIQEAQCTINVEVIYHGCVREALVMAPAVKLRNLDLQQMYNDCLCTDVYEFRDVNANDTGWLSRDAVNNITDIAVGENSTAKLIPKSQSDGCYIAIGRPFRDDTATIISSEAQIEETPQWSVISDETREAASVADSIAANTELYSELASEWTNRALGEHASIASFAAFTIALMTNQAPPDLIRDALQAAQEERRHAEVSFEMASLLSGSIIEPTALPPTTLTFEKNLTALALAAAREGCIEETLSALKMASDVDTIVLQGSKELKFFVEKTRSIALEEAGHSALAWRTVHWVCKVDSGACALVLRDVLNERMLVKAAVGRFASSQGALAWQCIYESLLPKLKDLDHENSIRPVSCQLKCGSLVGSVVDRILEKTWNDEQITTG